MKLTVFLVTYFWCIYLRSGDGEVSQSSDENSKIHDSVESERSKELSFSPS